MELESTLLTRNKDIYEWLQHWKPHRPPKRPSAPSPVLFLKGSDMQCLLSHSCILRARTIIHFLLLSCDPHKPAEKSAATQARLTLTLPSPSACQSPWFPPAALMVLKKEARRVKGRGGLQTQLRRKPLQRRHTLKSQRNGHLTWSSSESISPSKSHKFPSVLRREKSFLVIWVSK